MAIQLNADNYQGMMDSITALFSAGGISSVNVSVYTDAEATTFATDTNGAPVSNAPISKSVLTPTIQNSDGDTIYGNVTIFFKTGSSFVLTDGGAPAWYVLSVTSY
jgi:hypothetical protein